MKHRIEKELHDQIFEYALGLMNNADKPAFEERMAKDPEVRSQVFDLQHVHQQTLESLPVVHHAPPLSPKTLKRIRRKDSGVIVNYGQFWKKVGIAAACLMLCAISAMMMRLSLQMKEQQAMSTALKEQIQSQSLGELAPKLKSDNQTHLVISQLKSPTDPLDEYDTEIIREQKLMQLTVVSESIWELVDIESDSSQSHRHTPFGYVLMDVENNSGYLAIDDLQNTPGHILHIWLRLKNRTQPVFAGVLPQLEQNKGLLYFDFTDVLSDHNYTPIEEIFVTEENGMNRETPRGPILLGNS